MNGFKWWMTSTRMFFDENASGSGGEAGSGSASSGSSAPSSGGGSEAGSSSPSPDGGGAASPAEPSSPDAPAADDGSMDWSNLGSTDDLDSIEIPAEPPQPAPAAKPKKYGNAEQTPEPAAPPPVQPTPAQPQPEPPKPAAPPPPQAAPAEAPPQPVQLSPADPVGIATALEANRDAAIAHLAQTRFALSQEDIAELEDNAAVFVPKMMARVLHESQVSMMKFLAQSVPGMMQKFQTVTTANTAAEDQFFATHKNLGLDKSNMEHRKAAFRIASIYRKANPDIPLEQLMADVGPMVALSLKLPLVPGAQVPGQPSGNLQPAPTARPTGFRPAVNGGGGAPPVPEAGNEWSGLGQEFD